jgi:3-oxoacyl-[acyl-carrier-protein] synthase III
MAGMLIEHVRIAGLASAVPEDVQTLDDLAAQFGEEEAGKIAESIGVRTRRVAPEGMCASDLCHAAAEKLLDDMEWDRDSIRGLIFVSQTPDYRSPATACTLHSRLKLSKSCAAMDINLGCSGYVYGLATAAQFVRGLSNGNESSGRVLLLVGDTITRVVSAEDRSAVPLFGDAGTATALDYSESADPISVVFGTDGAGQDHLIVPAGGFRNPSTESTAQPTERENGNVRSDEDLFMNGAEVFMFTLCEVPSLFKKTMKASGWSIDDVDGVIMHQANSFMLNHLRKRLKIPEEKFVIALDGYGNASCASIPLAITDGWANKGPETRRKLVLAGFGVGWSWAGATVNCEQTVMPELIVLSGAACQSTDGEDAPITETVEISKAA